MTAHQLTIEPVELPSARQIAQKLATVALLVGVGIVVATQLPGVRDIGHQLAGADGGWITVALILELASTASFALAFHGVYDRRPGARASTSMSLAVQGMNIVLPSGGAGGLAVVTSLVSFAAVVIAGFGVASGLLAGEAKLALTLLPGALALLVIAGVFMLSRSRGPVNRAPAGRLGRAVANARTYLRDGVRASVELLRSGDRLVIAGAIGYFAFDVAALAAAFHAVGSAGLPIGLLVLAYTLGHGGALVPIPGSAEGGLIGMFVLYGMSLPTATAAVLAYRALHAGVPMLLGAIGLADVRRLLRDPAQAVAPRAPRKLRHHPAAPQFAPGPAISASAA